QAMESDIWRRVGRGISDDKVRQFADSIDVTNKGYVITVAFKDTDPNAAMAGAQSVVKAYEDLNREQENDRRKKAQEFLAYEAQVAKGKVETTENDIRRKIDEKKEFQNDTAADLFQVFLARL